MKRLDQYLLTHHPLVWNLRLHHIWPAIIVLHILFFIAGFASVSLPESLNYYGLHTGEGAASMAVLCAILLGVGWLIFYFRHNAFKKAYPLRKGRLAGEALLVLLTCIGLTTFTATHEGACYSRMRSLTADVNIERETDISNLAHHFLPFNRSSFSQREDCAYRADTSRMRTYSYDAAAVDTFSYLHYCSNDLSPYYAGGITRSPEGNDSIAKRWLLGGRRDSVKWVITEFLKLTRKYNGKYEFDAKAHVAQIFSEPGFPVRAELRRSEPQQIPPGSSVETVQVDEAPMSTTVDAPVGPEPGDMRFIEENNVSNALSTISQARRGWLDWSIAQFLLYFSLGLALLVFSFRITSVRTWFIALIGTGVWMAIFGTLAGVFGGEKRIMILFLVLTIVFLGWAIYLIGRRREKGKAGVLYLWALWALPAFLPLAANLISDYTRPHNSVYDPVTKAYVTPPAPVHDWISANWHLIGGSNFVLFLLLLLLLFIPLARRWQAAPEE